MSTLIITRGLPGSGKSTWGREYVRTHPLSLRVGRDDIRVSEFGWQGGIMTPAQEDVVTRKLNQVTRDALRAGITVVSDSQNLRDREVKSWVALATSVGSDWSVQDFRHVPLPTVLAQNANPDRVNVVPVDYITAQHEKFIRGKKLTNDFEAPVPFSFMRVEMDENLSSAAIFDMDGTLALCGDRDIYDSANADRDHVNPPVAEVAKALKKFGHAIVIVTARPAEHQAVTEKWLQANGIEYDAIYTRATGDNRDDSIVKSEILDRIVAEWNIMGAFDDRSRVVNMWRARGVTAFQVAEGDF